MHEDAIYLLLALRRSLKRLIIYAQVHRHVLSVIKLIVVSEIECYLLVGW